MKFSLKNHHRISASELTLVLPHRHLFQVIDFTIISHLHLESSWNGNFVRQKNKNSIHGCLIIFPVYIIINNERLTFWLPLSDVAFGWMTLCFMWRKTENIASPRWEWCCILSTFDEFPTNIAVHLNEMAGRHVWLTGLGFPWDSVHVTHRHMATRKTSITRFLFSRRRDNNFNGWMTAKY